MLEVSQETTNLAVEHAKISAKSGLSTEECGKFIESRGLTREGQIIQKYGIAVQKHAQAAKEHAEALVKSRSQEDLILEIHEHGLAVNAHLKAVKEYLQVSMLGDKIQNTKYKIQNRAFYAGGAIATQEKPHPGYQDMGLVATKTGCVLIA